MSHQFLAESPEIKRQIASRKSVPPSTRLSHGSLPSALLQLQRTLGNQHVAQLIQSRRLTPEGRIIGIQPKLTVGAADDQYEQEADRVARQVMSMPEAVTASSMQRAVPDKPTAEKGTAEEDLVEEEKEQILQTKSLAAAITPWMQRQTQKEPVGTTFPQARVNELNRKLGSNTLQRQSVPEEEEIEPLQAQSADALTDGFEAGADVESQLNRSKGAGSPLPASVRSFMEPRFGMDFSQVRMHTGSEAVQMNRDVGANAFTHGSDIYYGAGHNPHNLELTAHELTHVVQQTGGAPLQTKRREEADAADASPSIQRSCSACNEGKKEEEEPGLSASKVSGSLQAKRIQGSGGSKYAAQRLPGPPRVNGRTGGPVVQGAWALTETVRNSTPVIGDRTRENGNTLAIATPTGVYGKAKAWQKAGFWQIYGGNAHLVMRRDTRYTFVHTGTDNNLLTLRGGASIFGGAEADDLHYGQAGAAIAGNIAVRTIADPAPKQKSLFPPIHDGGRSEAEKSSIGEVDVSLPVGDATVDVKIPLTKTDEGELATLSESMPFHRDEPGGGEWKSVDVYLVAYIELAADIENEFWGTDGDVNWASATAQYNLAWEERPVPAPEEGEEGEILVKRRCWSARNCEGKAYNQKFSHCHNCKNYASGKSLGEPGNCENC